MRPTRLALLTLAFSALAACSAPPTTGGTSTASTNTPYVPDTPTSYGPGDYCAETYVLLQPTTRSNFSLGSEYYRNGDYCAAYPYIKQILATEPLFTGEDPDDRNYLRMASIYEDFAANVDSTNQAERVAYLDSALTTRQAGVAALEREGIAYDSYLRDLREGFFYFQNSALYEDAEQKQFEAFTRAFEAKPDSLEDWYLTRLFAGSAAEFGDEIPNPERAAYIRSLSEAIDDAALKSNYEQFATYIETEPDAGGIPPDAPDSVVEGLVAELTAGTLSESDARTLLRVVIDAPDRLTALDEDVDEIRSRILRLEVMTRNIDNPRTLLALAFQAYRDGERTRGDGFFDRAIAGAESNVQRADFLYYRGASDVGTARDFDRALDYFPSHGPSLYRRAGLAGQAVGRPTSLEGRFAYWCLADTYRSVAAQTTGQIASNARRAAAGYERSAPPRAEYFLAGYEPGQPVTASLGAYGSCTTRVR